MFHWFRWDGNTFSIVYSLQRSILGGLVKNIPYDCQQVQNPAGYVGGS